MSIQVLNPKTIDKIAAGEVVERPASIVKELVENAIDAGATEIRVEIEEGGTSLILVKDNGCGIEKNEVPTAFLRHATSKIQSEEDLLGLGSLGFRGEALSSIAAISRLEIQTKIKNAHLGVKFQIHGGEAKDFEEIGMNDGTTFFVRHLFYNTPARKKFLKSPTTEGGYIGDLMTRMALSHPEISFLFLNQGQIRLHTSGNGNLKDIIYHVYGREIANQLLPIHFEENHISIKGFLGKPLISRGNRNFETYFINGRYIKSSILSKGIEEGYRDFTMQHKYPFVVLHMDVEPSFVDVNVHPAKMEVRFQDHRLIYGAITKGISKVLHGEELIPKMELNEEKETKEELREKNKDYYLEKMRERVASYHRRNSQAEVEALQEIFRPEIQVDRIREQVRYGKEEKSPVIETKQLNLLEENLLKREEIPEYRLIGQVFDTYWLLEFQESLYIMDQHAAHERVLYEKLLKEMEKEEVYSQSITPPIVVDLEMREANLLRNHLMDFHKVGFEIEEFGGDSFAIRGVPLNLYGLQRKDLFLEMMDGLWEEGGFQKNVQALDEKIASMSCKAAVKGKDHLSFHEVNALIGDLLRLENPYHCPHGRPILISFSKKDLEKKFKRIVS